MPFLYKGIASLVNTHGNDDRKLTWGFVITWLWIGGKYPVYGKSK